MTSLVLQIVCSHRNLLKLLTMQDIITKYEMPSWRGGKAGQVVSGILLCFFILCVTGLSMHFIATSIIYFRWSSAALGN